MVVLLGNDPVVHTSMLLVYITIHILSIYMRDFVKNAEIAAGAYFGRECAH